MSTVHLRGRSSALPVWAIVVAGLSTAAWTTAAVVMSSRGLDLTDESFYLLSYRWWDSTPRAFSGVQYLYGPVFEFLGHDVAALRIFRLATVLAVHAIFAWAFVTWLGSIREDVTRSTGWAAGSLIVASGGIVYGWLPQTPGYNDVALLGSLLLCSVVLRSLSVVNRTGRLPVIAALLAGPVLLTVILAKWSSALLIVALLGAVLVLASRTRATGWFRYLAAASMGFVIAGAVFHVLVQPWDEVIPPMLEVNQLAAASSNSPTALVTLYLQKGGVLLGIALLLCVPAGAILLAARRLPPRFAAWASGLAFLSPFCAVLLVAPDRFGMVGGGADLVNDYTVALLAPCLLVAAALLLERPQVSTTGLPSIWPVLAGLVALPVIQAAGTGNAVHFLAVNQYACWMAVLVWCAVASTRGVRALAYGALASSVLVVSGVAVSGLLVHPYRTSGFMDADRPVGGVGILSELKVSTAEAEVIAAARTAAGSRPTGSPVMAFDEIAGLVLALDGRSVGEAWYSAIDHTRTAAGIEATCASRTLKEAPVVIFNRPVGESDVSAIRSCGYQLDRDFRGVPVALPQSLRVFVPRDRDREPDND